MKKIILLLLFVSCSHLVLAQKSYDVNGERYELKTEVEGSIDLLWAIIDGNYRYFIKKQDESIIELTNTRLDSGDYDEAYKSTLAEATQGSNLATDKLKFTLYDLRTFIDTYNAAVDSSYNSTNVDAKLKTRLLIFGGLTNSPFVDNPENESNPLFGAELEFYSSSAMPRHSLFFQVKHVLDSDEFPYSTTQLGLGYRFRFVNKESFNIYANVIAATYNFSKSKVTIIDENSNVTTEERSADAFDVPFIFGVGADIRVSDNSFITITYDELFAAFFDNQGNFSTDIAIGYKFNL